MNARLLRVSLFNGWLYRSRTKAVNCHLPPAIGHRPSAIETVSLSDGLRLNFAVRRDIVPHRTKYWCIFLCHSDNRQTENNQK